jgi:hypothetical protein
MKECCIAGAATICMREARIDGGSDATRAVIAPMQSALAMTQVDKTTPAWKPWLMPGGAGIGIPTALITTALARPTAMPATLPTTPRTAPSSMNSVSTWRRVSPTLSITPTSQVRSSTFIVIVFRMLSTMSVVMTTRMKPNWRLNNSAVW